MSSRKKMTTSNVTVSLGCGTCQRASKFLSNIFNPKPKPNKTLSTPRRAQYINPSYSSTTSWQTTDSSTNYFSDGTDDSDNLSIRAVESLAVEKDSDDPYLDFRQSMLQMIIENDIYGKEDLRELLSCFLQLNEPYLHGIIVRAFTEIWNGVYLGRVVSSSSIYMHGSRRSREY